MRRRACIYTLHTPLCRRSTVRQRTPSPQTRSLKLDISTEARVPIVHSTCYSFWKDLGPDHSNAACCPFRRWRLRCAGGIDRAFETGPTGGGGLSQRRRYHGSIARGPGTTVGLPTLLSVRWCLVAPPSLLFCATYAAACCCDYNRDRDCVQLAMTSSHAPVYRSCTMTSCFNQPTGPAGRRGQTSALILLLVSDEVCTGIIIMCLRCCGVNQRQNMPSKR